jgi:hypothetical protein
LLFPVILVVTFVVKAYRHKKWHWREAKNILLYIEKALVSLIKKVFKKMRENEFEEPEINSVYKETQKEKKK